MCITDLSCRLTSQHSSDYFFLAWVEAGEGRGWELGGVRAAGGATATLHVCAVVCSNLASLPAVVWVGRGSPRLTYISVAILMNGFAVAAVVDDDGVGGGYEDEMLLVIGCLTSQQHASVSQGRICSDNLTCYHTEIEVADQTFHLTQSQYLTPG